MTAPNAPTADSTTSSPPPGTTSPASATTASPSEFRFGPESELWMQGKTPAEVTVIAKQLAEVAARAVVQPQPQYQQPMYQGQPGQPYYVVPAQSQAQPEPPLGPDDYVTGKVLQDMGGRYVQEVQRYVNPAIEMAASSNYDRIREKYAKDFAKYGHEIAPLLQNLPKTEWSIDKLTTVVDLVRGRHVEELASERAAQLAANPSSALRSTGAPGTSPAQTSPNEGLTDVQRESLKRRGITPEMVADFCAKKGDGTTPQQWYQQFGKYSVGDAPV